MTEPRTEPWMRGHLAGMDPVLAAVLYALEQAREDLAARTEHFTDEQLWRAVGDAAPVGFHIRHIAGSVDRLTTYALGEQLTPEQMATLKRESERELSRDDLFVFLDQSFGRAAEAIRRTDPARFSEPRYIGRKRIPTTLAGLLVHIAEHTQRHTGAVIVTSKLVSS